MFAIGDAEWPGLSKLVEEAGEVQQVIGKLMGAGGQKKHWDGTNLKARLEDELADLKAAIDFVIERNGLDVGTISVRKFEKLGLFNKWHTEQSKP